MLVNQSVVLDVFEGNLALGRWQDVALAEFDGPRERRQVLVKIWPDAVAEPPLGVDAWETVFTRRGPGQARPLARARHSQEAPHCIPGAEPGVEQS